MSDLKHADIFNWIETWAPLTLAYDWDNVGLQIGSKTNNVKKILVTLDVSEAVVDEAIEKQVNLIISHHPLLFKPLTQVDVNKPKGRIVQKLLQHDITVYSAHTNLDIANGGINDMLCDMLNVCETKPLIERMHESLYKLIVFVPQSHAEKVRDALSEGGAGHIGNYSHCTFQAEGQGTFKPLEGTDPFIGTKGNLEFVDEIKIESIVPEQNLSSTIHAKIKAHPYEEVAYDIYPLENKGTTYGLGRVGKLAEKVNLETFCQTVKETFNMPYVRVTGDLSKNVQKVAIVGGSGEKYLTEAKRKGADVYITGDMTFHQAQVAEEIGLSVIDAGHYIEYIMKEHLAEKLESAFKNDQIDVLASLVNTDPFQFK